MMHELFMNVVYACGIVVSAAAAAVAVKFSFSYVVKGKERVVPKSVFPSPPPLEHTREIIRQIMPMPEPEPEAAPAPKKRMRLRLPEFIKPAPEEPSTEPEEEIACGNCQEVIHSQPVGGEAKAGNVFVRFYDCEHCGARVEV